MATVTRVLSTFYDDAGNECRFEFDYDDTSMRVGVFRCVNNTAQQGWGHIERESDGLTYEQQFPPGTTFRNIPQTPANRITLSILAGTGKLVGYRASFMWPFP